MYLGEMIAELKKHKKGKAVRLGFRNPHEYVLSPGDVAFEQSDETTVGAMLNCAEEEMYTTTRTHKGGYYREVWLATYDERGERIGPVMLKLMLGQH